MKKLILGLVAASALGAAALPASAATWPSVGQRQAELDRRIDMGVRQHTLTRAEARHLHAELQRIERLEHHYRRGGLNRWEMADLDRRMDALARQIRIDRHDYDRVGYGYGDRHYRR